MNLPPAVAESLARRLAAATGIDARSLEPARLRWIVAARCRHLGLADADAYDGHLEASASELDALIDEVVVQETRFFRDAAVFEHLRLAIPALAARAAGPLRILSAPCGTGQEAYSVAATLVRAGLPLSGFSIDAFDLSLAALDTARRGVYPAHLLQHLGPELQDCVAVRRESQCSIRDDLRQRIRFERRNLAEPDALAGEGAYDLILCRNLFIYLHPQARTTLAESLAAALAPGGRLILGTADRVEELSLHFAALRPAASFAFTSRTAIAAAIPAQARVPPAVPARSFRAIAAPVQHSALTTPGSLFARALHHQQQGNLRTAERRCRQALYLAPDFLPALELLDMLWRQQPNLRLRRALTARILRTRAATAAAVTQAAQETA
jgi:chemotaxis protein methyltransferase WspC